MCVNQNARAHIRNESGYMHGTRHTRRFHLPIYPSIYLSIYWVRVRVRVHMEMGNGKWRAATYGQIILWGKHSYTHACQIRYILLLLLLLYPSSIRLVCSVLLLFLELQQCLIGRVLLLFLRFFFVPTPSLCRIVVWVSFFFSSFLLWGPFMHHYSVNILMEYGVVFWMPFFDFTDTRVGYCRSFRSFM